MLGSVKLRAIGDNLENMQDEFQMMRAFIAKKFPGEDQRNVMEHEKNDEVDLHERATDNVIQHEINYDIQRITSRYDFSKYFPSDTHQFFI